MSLHPCVSVIVPVYNMQKYVGQCVNSLICQTIQEIEIIAIDDGSTDNSGALLDGYAKLDARIKVIHQNNGGYGKAMNAGLQAATGKYTGILEADDFCDPQMFATLYNISETHSLDVAKSNFYYFWSKNLKTQTVHLAPDSDYGRVFTPENYKGAFTLMPSIWSAIYRKSMLDKNDIRFTETPGASYQDTAFNMKVWCVARRCMLINSPLVWYRQDNEESSTRSRNKVMNICHEYDEALKYARARQSELLPYVEKMRFGGYMWNYDRISWLDRIKFARRMRKDFNKAIAEGIHDEELLDEQQNRDYRQIAKNPVIFHLKKLKKQILRKFQ